MNVPCFFQQFALAIIPAANVDNALLRTNANAPKNTVEVNRDAEHVRIKNYLQFCNRIRALRHTAVTTN